jgi:hypothetical protein
MSARIGCSAQAVHQWYGSRDELIIVVTATPMLADLRESERQLMMRLFPRLAGPAGAGGDELTTLTLVVAGLRAALCRADAPSTVIEARTTLLKLQALLAGPLADWVSRSAPGRTSSPLD